MALSRAIGGGHLPGTPIEMTVIPDSTFAAEITVLITAATPAIEGLMVQFVTTGAYTVTSPANDTNPDGQIISYELDATSTYVLTCAIWGYADYEANKKAATCVRHLPYGSSGTIALGQEILMNIASGTTPQYVDGTNSGGIGKVLRVDATNYYVDVIL